MKSFIVAVMAAALIMVGSIATAGAQYWSDSYFNHDGDMKQGAVTEIAVESIDLDYYGFEGALGAGSVDIVGGQMMEIEGYGNTYNYYGHYDDENGNAFDDNTCDYTQDQTLEATYMDSSVVGTQESSVFMETIEDCGYYAHVNMEGEMLQGGVTGIAIDSFEFGPASLIAGSIDAIGIQSMTTWSNASGAGMEGLMNLTQTLTVTTPTSTIIMNQNANYESSSNVPVVPET